MGTLTDWTQFFNSTRRPNFGEVIPKYGTPDFEKEYLWSEPLKEFHYRLLDTLTGTFEMLNVLITGNPGIGKTSFLYFLRHRFEASPDQKYVLKIFHTNHARGHSKDSDVEERVQKEILEGWEALYNKNGHDVTFGQITNAGHSLRKTLNELSDYYLRNKSKFSSMLILAVDDVDLLDKDELVKIVKYVCSNIEAKSAKKWFFVRPQTYRNYDEKTKDFLQGFFPDIRELPRTRLHDIVKHRIAAVSKDEVSRSPFSPHLCAYIEELVDHNIRRAFPALERILCEISRPAKSETAEEVVRNYVDRAAIRSLIGQSLIPDIHSPDFRTVSFPLPLDLLRFLLYSADLAILKPCLDIAVKERYQRSRPQGLKRVSTDIQTRKKPSPYVRDVDLSFTLDELVKAQLVEKRGPAYRLTSRGKVVALFSAQPYFLEQSITKTPEQINYDEDYVRLADIKIDHQGIAETFLLRSF